MKLTVLVSYSGQGGVEAVTLTLLPILNQLCELDVLLIKARGPFIERLYDLKLPIKKLKKSSAKFCVPEIRAHLQQHQPDVLLAIKHRALMTALKAKRGSDVPTQIWGQIHTNNTQSMANKHWLERVIRMRAIKKWYPKADKILSVSQGIADDIAAVADIEKARLPVIYNPVFSLAQAPAPVTVTHPWLDEPSDIPVILGVGRFSKQKGFDVLIEAFSKLRKRQHAKLLLLGDGELRAAFEQQVNDLGISNDVAMPGFTQRPQDFMAKSQLFVLSSRWEGFGLVLVEAMAAGCPVISTDCPSGPSEILAGGKHGVLVAVDDEQALQQAMFNALQRPRSQCSRESVRPFSVESVFEKYRQLIENSA